MNKKKLLDWFNEKLNNCYHIEVNGGGILWIYDKNYARKLKLAQIDDKKIDLTYDKNKVLFYQKNKYFICDYEKIWRFFYFNYSHNYIYVQTFIKEILEQHNLKQYIPLNNYDFFLSSSS